MDTLAAISLRRSIRRFKDTPVPQDVLHTILTAATQAPSGKNRQPWRFVVVSGEDRAEMVRRMRAGMARMKAEGHQLGSTEGTASIMEQAPVTVFVFYPNGTAPWLARSVDQTFTDHVDIQAIGAAIQNLLLAAQDRGIGSLWIADILIAYNELCEWLGEPGELIAAVSLGYADESPPARPRKPLSKVVRWL
jgi:F420 biosynthesis protein FbiB-like protein